MLRHRRAQERGHAEHGWLDSRHTFSFAHYYDPDHMGFGPLRVINEDRVRPGRGFGTHAHRDMEIISYVLEGALEHRDSMGNGSVIRPGDVQVMSAGTGVQHSEFNASKEEPVHFLQIWIEPDARGGAPSYGQRHYPKEARLNRLRAVASPDGRDGSLEIKQDAVMYAGVLEPGATVTHDVADGRRMWLHVARGTISAGETTLGAGDAIASDDTGALQLRAETETEVILFDLP
ncbi:MAG: pirin family protein [Nannocystaceae bacterium]|nr:pirin family protein [bacterium]